MVWQTLYSVQKIKMENLLPAHEVVPCYSKQGSMVTFLLHQLRSEQKGVWEGDEQRMLSIGTVKIWLPWQLFKTWFGLCCQWRYPLSVHSARSISCCIGDDVLFLTPWIHVPWNRTTCLQHEESGGQWGGWGVWCTAVALAAVSSKEFIYC